MEDVRLFFGHKWPEREVNLHDDVWFEFCWKDGMFLAEGYGHRYVAEGFYNPDDGSYDVWHGSSARDKDAIVGLLKAGRRPVTSH